MDVLTLKSKVKLDCIRCEKCCIYRGDIRISPLNLCQISKFLNITTKEFLEKYTDRLYGNLLEIVLKTVKKEKQCILYNEKIKGCSIHKVKPMQCVMFPLIPENLKRDYFYNSEQCVLEDAKEITVNQWINGNNKIYSKFLSPSDKALVKATLSAQIACIPWFSILQPVYIFPLFAFNTAPTLKLLYGTYAFSLTLYTKSISFSKFI